MKQLLYRSSIATLMVYTVATQAYTFTVKNFTKDEHNIQIELKGPGNIIQTATIDPHPIHQNFLGKAFGQVKQWASQVQQEVSNKLANISKNLMNTSESELETKLADLKFDLESKIRNQALKVGAKKWVVELDKLKTDLHKAGRKFDKNVLQKKLAELNSEIINLAADEQEPNTAIFSFTGLKVGLCVKKIVVDGKQSIPIYGLDNNQYSRVHNYIEKNDYTNFAATIADNIKGGFYTNMSKSFIGICFSRQFDLVELSTGELVWITKELL